MHAHTLIDERSLAIHTVIAKRLADEPWMLERARKRVAEWQSTPIPTMNPKYPEAWARLLSGPIEQLVEVLLSPSETATELRHVSPFAGVVDMATRERIWREVQERVQGACANEPSGRVQETEGKSRS